MTCPRFLFPRRHAGWIPAGSSRRGAASCAWVFLYGLDGYRGAWSCAPIRQTSGMRLHTRYAPIGALLFCRRWPEAPRDQGVPALCRAQFCTRKIRPLEFRRYRCLQAGGSCRHYPFLPEAPPLQGLQPAAAPPSGIGQDGMRHDSCTTHECIEMTASVRGRRLIILAIVVFEREIIPQTY